MTPSRVGAIRIVGMVIEKRCSGLLTWSMVLNASQSQRAVGGPSTSSGCSRISFALRSKRASSEVSGLSSKESSLKLLLSCIEPRPRPLTAVDRNRMTPSEAACPVSPTKGADSTILSIRVESRGAAESAMSPPVE